MSGADSARLRRAIASGNARIEIEHLELDAIEDIAWSGSRSHLENVAEQLLRARKGEVVYLVIRADRRAVSKGGIDFTKEAGAGTVWQLATHTDLEGLGLATRLIAELEQHALDRGISRLRLGVEVDNPRAKRLYERLGYRTIGESDASWDAEDADGTRFLYSTKLIEMEKLL